MTGRGEYDYGRDGDWYGRVDRWERGWMKVEVCSDGRYCRCAEVGCREI